MSPPGVRAPIQGPASRRTLLRRLGLMLLPACLAPLVTGCAQRRKEPPPKPSQPVLPPPQSV